MLVYQTLSAGCGFCSCTSGNKRYFKLIWSHAPVGLVQTSVAYLALVYLRSWQGNGCSDWGLNFGPNKSRKTPSSSLFLF